LGHLMRTSGIGMLSNLKVLGQQILDLSSVSIQHGKDSANYRDNGKEQRFWETTFDCAC
jgi:hypothetical protein